MNSRRFHITPRSVLAAFLLMSGLQSVILSLREPLGSIAIVAVNWLIGRIKPDAFRLKENSIAWPYFWVETAVGLILVMLAMGFAASALRRKSIS